MKFVHVLLSLMSVVLPAQVLSAQEQDQEELLYERVEEEADRLQRTLKLEDWQVFYVDSILKHDYSAMMAEYEKLHGSKVSNTSLYIVVQDKWMDKIDAALNKVFDEQQWATYMKNGAARAKKARDKRRAKAAGL